MGSTPGDNQETSRHSHVIRGVGWVCHVFPGVSLCHVARMSVPVVEVSLLLVVVRRIVFVPETPWSTWNLKGGFGNLVRREKKFQQIC